MEDKALESKLEALTQRDLKELLSNATQSAAFIAYHYPRYSYEEAAELPHGDAKQLIIFAMRHEATANIRSLEIAAAATKYESYKKLSTRLMRQLEKIK